MNETTALAGTARLFGRLLLVELTRERLDELAGVRSELAEVGVELPEPDGSTLAELGAEFFAAFLNPTEGAPPIQSLWSHGVYESEPVQALRTIADAAALEYDKDAARGAPLDHLGSILTLWAEAITRSPSAARRIEEGHLAWARAPLAATARRGGFYGSLAVATIALIEEISAGAGVE